MSITRADAEIFLVARAKKLMELLGMEVTTVGSNPDLLDPLATAFRRMGYVSDSVAVLTNTDLADIPNDKYDEFLDRAELRLLQNMLGNWDVADINIGSRSESLGSLRTGLEKRIDRLTDKVKNEYGDGAATLRGGVIELDFQQTNEDDE